MEHGQKDIGPLVDAIAEGKTSLKCSSGNRITQLCISKNCKAYAGFCNDEDCQTCFQPHELCDSVRTASTSKLLQACFQHQKHFIEHFTQIQQNIIQSIKSSNKNFEKQILLSLFTGKHQNIIESLYLNKNQTSFKANQCLAFKNWLLETAAKAENKGRQFLQFFEKEANKILDQLKAVEQKLINEYTSICSGLIELDNLLQNDSMISEITQPIILVNERNQINENLGQVTMRTQRVQIQKSQLQQINQQLKNEVNRLTKDQEKYVKQIKRLQKQLNQTTALLNKQKYQVGRLQLFRNNSFQQYFKFDSKIIKSVDSQPFYYLYDSLNCPKSMTLLFRASYNQFSGQNFRNKWPINHQTVTLIHTQQNYIVACYLAVNSQKFTNSYIADNSKKSFILSISQRFKMKLRDPQKAFKYTNYYAGPAFGEDDVYISSKCNLNRDSHFNIPTSYELPQNTQIKNFDKLKCNFKVWQYEVFQIQHF